MANNTTPGSSKQAAREGARKHTAQKVARERQTRASGTSKGKKRQVVESSDEGSDIEEAPPPKKRAAPKKKKARTENTFDEDGVAIVNGEDGEEEGDGDGAEELDDEELDGELSDEQVLRECLRNLGCARAR